MTISNSYLVRFLKRLLLVFTVPILIVIAVLFAALVFIWSLVILGAKWLFMFHMSEEWTENLHTFLWYWIFDVYILWGKGEQNAIS